MRYLQTEQVPGGHTARRCAVEQSDGNIRDCCDIRCSPPEGRTSDQLFNTRVDPYRRRLAHRCMTDLAISQILDFCPDKTSDRAGYERSNSKRAGRVRSEHCTEKIAQTGTRNHPNSVKYVTSSYCAGLLQSSVIINQLCKCCSVVMKVEVSAAAYIHLATKKFETKKRRCLWETQLFEKRMYQGVDTLISGLKFHDVGGQCISSNTSSVQSLMSPVAFEYLIMLIGVRISTQDTYLRIYISSRAVSLRRDYTTR